MSDLPSLPAWAKTLQRRIRQRGIDFFILHGPGVRDLHPLGTRRFGTIAGCLAQVILNDRSAIVTYDRGAGIGFSDRDVENDFKTVLKAYDKLGGTNLAQVQPRDPDRARSEERRVGKEGRARGAADNEKKKTEDQLGDIVFKIARTCKCYNSTPLNSQNQRV